LGVAKLNRKQAKTLAAIFADPTSSNIAWRDIAQLFASLEAEISLGSGSRVRVKLGAIRRVFHEPHPERTAQKALVRNVREFLQLAGITGEG
jgi:hypothetical protein